MAYETVRYDVADQVATIALDQPDSRNALSDELLTDLLAAFTAARYDDDVRAVVLLGEDEVLARPAVVGFEDGVGRGHGGDGTHRCRQSKQWHFPLSASSHWADRAMEHVRGCAGALLRNRPLRSEEHTSELQSLV